MAEGEGLESAGPSFLADPHALNRRRHIRYPESDGFAKLEVRDQSGHAPRVELAAADLEVSGKLSFSHQVEFGAQRSRLRVHAQGFRVNRNGA